MGLGQSVVVIYNLETMDNHWYVVLLLSCIVSEKGLTPRRPNGVGLDEANRGEGVGAERRGVDSDEIVR